MSMRLIVDGRDLAPVYKDEYDAGEIEVNEFNKGYKVPWTKYYNKHACIMHNCEHLEEILITSIKVDEPDNIKLRFTKV